MNGSRREFLQAACAGLGATLLDRNISPEDLENTFKEIRKNVFEMINEERDVEKVPLVELDDLATEVATKHAVDLVTNEFIGHWGSDGLKPYHRYSAAGGTIRSIRSHKPPPALPLFYRKAIPCQPAC